MNNITTARSFTYHSLPLVSAFGFENLLKFCDRLVCISEWSVLILTVFIANSSPVGKQNPVILMFIFPDLKI